MVQTSHQPDALLNLRCCYGRLLARVLLTRRPSNHSAGEFPFLLQHQAGQRQQAPIGLRRVAMAAVFHGIQRCTDLRCGRLTEGREPRPLVRRARGRSRTVHRCSWLGWHSWTRLQFDGHGWDGFVGDRITPA